MAVKKLAEKSSSCKVFKPKAEEGSTVTESGVYNLDICKATFNEETSILVLLGIPSRTNEAGEVDVFKLTPVCVCGKYSYDVDFNPIINLFEVFGLDVDDEVDLDFFKGKKVQVFIDVSIGRTGRIYCNAEEFGTI